LLVRRKRWVAVMLGMRLAVSWSPTRASLWPFTYVGRVRGGCVTGRIMLAYSCRSIHRVLSRVSSLSQRMNASL